MGERDAGAEVVRSEADRSAVGVARGLPMAGLEEGYAQVVVGVRVVRPGLDHVAEGEERVGVAPLLEQLGRIFHRVPVGAIPLLLVARHAASLVQRSESSRSP